MCCPHNLGRFISSTDGFLRNVIALFYFLPVLQAPESLDITAFLIRTNHMEVDSQTAKEWKRENNRACYLQKTMNALGIEVISYNVSPNVEDWEVNGEALLEDPDCHVEDDVLRSILTENMLDAMCHLSEIEQKVITHLYLSDDPMTEHEFEKAFGVKRCTVHYYKVSALEQLREMLSENV